MLHGSQQRWIKACMGHSMHGSERACNFMAHIHLVFRTLHHASALELCISSDVASRQIQRQKARHFLADPQVDIVLQALAVKLCLYAGVASAALWDLHNGPRWGQRAQKHCTCTRRSAPLHVYAVLSYLQQRYTAPNFAALTTDKLPVAKASMLGINNPPALNSGDIRCTCSEALFWPHKHNLNGPNNRKSKDPSAHPEHTNPLQHSHILSHLQPTLPQEACYDQAH